MRYEDEVKGKAKQVKGTAKANVGKLVNDRDLVSSGEADRAAGRTQEKLGKAKRKIGEAIEDLGEKVAS
jgi:uncharacterized protein YjbJ (UPF0337 family)